MPRPSSRPPNATESFDAFATAHMADLGRLAYMLTGDRDAADDIVADALMSAWRNWDRVSRADNPRAYVRGAVVKLSASRVRSLVRERSRLSLLAAGEDEVSSSDPATAMDVRQALRELPTGQRVCVVLRYGMDMSEAEVASVLKVSVGTVKSQTSKGASRLRRLLQQQYEVGRAS